MGCIGGGGGGGDDCGSKFLNCSSMAYILLFLEGSTI